MPTVCQKGNGSVDRFSSLQLFIRVVERGNFTHVGRELGPGQPAVSKQIAALETHLGAQLLSRTSRGLQPTTAGQDLYESAIRILGEREEAEVRIGQKTSTRLAWSDWQRRQHWAGCISFRGFPAFLPAILTSLLICQWPSVASTLSEMESMLPCGWGHWPTRR